jgi:hypothetical protein
MLAAITPKVGAPYFCIAKAAFIDITTNGRRNTATMNLQVIFA